MSFRAKRGWFTLPLVLAACRSTPAIEAAPPGPVRSLVVEPVSPFAPQLVRLSPDSAAKLAKAGRDAVSVQLAPGLKLDLWAPEALGANDLIGLGFDDKGRMFVTSTQRSSQDEIDIRAHPDWMVPSITFKDVEDKRAFYQRILAPEKSAQNQWLDDYNKDGVKDWHDLTAHKESIFRLEDTNNDGIADVSQLIFKDQNDLVTDVADGVMSFKNDLYLTVSPDIWRLRDTNGDGVMDTKESLAHGSGVHIGFGGHGLSGPLIGPDGRLYWKQGDLGVNIISREGRRLSNPNSGVILRANPDGSDAEIFASGLRNPQEFAFDDYGNLITPDNDGDHQGESERLVYVVDGMETGWRINWQFGKYIDPDNNTYKVWMEEGMFRPRFTGQAAYFTPPIASWHAGPAGFDYNPGTALGEAWRNYFFGSVFTGTPGGSTVQGFTLAPLGAGFRLVEDKEVLRGIQVVGMKFGPDGALYLTDWIDGWDPKERGRIWRVDVADGGNAALRAETRALIAADFTSRSVSDLSALLRHADKRVRTKAQFALVERGAASELLASAQQTKHQLARIHGLWGLGQLARKDISVARQFVDFLKDGDPEIRAQAAKLIGDVRYADPSNDLIRLLVDPMPRTRFFAAEALGRVRYQRAIGPLVDMLAANDDEDVYLRHAGALALSRIGSVEPIVALADHRSRAVRLAAVVTLRRMRNAGVARFLHDRDELIVTEAARAINDDGGIDGGFLDLASVLDSTRSTSEPLLRRAINANLRVGTADAARRVGAYAGRASAPDAMRAEAIAVLGVWPNPSILDRVDGWHIGPAPHDSAAARAALATLVEPVFASGSTMLQVAVADAIGKLRLQSAATLMFDKSRSAVAAEVRIAALRALAKLGDPRTEQALRASLQDSVASVRTAALGAIIPLNLPETTTSQLLASVVGKGTVAEQQSALQALGQLPGTTGREMLTQFVDQLVAGKVAADIQLDVAEAARATKSTTLIARLDSITSSRTNAAPLIAYADALRGGDARRGGRVIFQGSTAQCTRCHNFGAGPGAAVGPPLRGVASRLQREQLLEALVDPSARIAPGFGPVQLTLKNGQRFFGTLKEETDEYIVVDAGSEPKRIVKTDIAQRTNGPSAMPAMGSILTRREIRDIVEYLSTLK